MLGAEALLLDRHAIATLDIKLAAIDARLMAVQGLLTKAAWASRSPALLPSPEALVLFLDVPSFGNLPEETLSWVVTLLPHALRRQRGASGKGEKGIRATHKRLEPLGCEGFAAIHVARRSGATAPLQGSVLTRQ
jgi:hypothetical protein